MSQNNITYPLALYPNKKGLIKAFHLAPLSGHSNCVNGIAERGDEQYMLSCSSDKTIKVWDAFKGHLVKTLNVNNEKLSDIKLTPDRDCFVVCSDDNSIIILDVDFNVVRTIKVSGKPLRIFEISTDSNYIIGGGYDNIIKVWELKTGNLILEFKGHQKTVNVIATSPKKMIAASVSASNKEGPQDIIVWEIPTGKIINIIKNYEIDNEFNPGCLSFDYSGKYLLAGMYCPYQKSEYPIKVIDFITGSVEKTLKGFKGGLKAVKADFYFNRVLAASLDEIGQWDLTTEELLYYNTLEIEKTNATFGTLTFNQDHSYYYYGDSKGNIYKWYTRENKFEYKIEAHNLKIISLGYTLDDKLVLSLENNLIQIFDFKTGNLLNSIKEDFNFYNIETTSDNTHFFALNYNKCIKSWDIFSGKEARVYTPDDKYSRCLCISPNNKYLFVGALGKIYVWDIQTGNLLKNFKAHNSYVYSLLVTSDNKYLISGAEDRCLKVWEIPSLNLINQTEELEYVNSLAKSNDDKLVYYTFGKTIQVRNLISQELIATFEEVPEAGDLNHLSLSYDGNYIATSTRETIIVWDTKSGKVFDTFKHSAFIFGLQFIPNTLNLIAADGTGDVYVWDLLWSKRDEIAKKQNENIKKIIEFENNKQAEITKAEMIREIGISINDTNSYLKFLTEPVNYAQDEIPTIEKQSEEILRKYPSPTLYNLVVRENYDFKTAKRIGKYLMENNLISEFPRYSARETKVVLKTTPTPEIVSEAPKRFEGKQLEILRGGDWKIEGNQSVFYYKVKVKNNTPFVLSNIQIILTSIPKGLETRQDRYKIDVLKPHSFESPTFKLAAKESCVGDTVEGMVIYMDQLGKQHTEHIQSLEICYVCNLLSPKPISRKEYEEKVEFMEEKKIIIDSNLKPSDLENIIAKKFQECNFALLQQMKDAQSQTLTKVEGFAQGLYDKQDVALSVVVKQVESGSQLVVKAMSDRAEKITDLLKDFNSKLDDIKSDTELIKEYSSNMEDLFDRIDDLERFLIENLGSDFIQIKYAYQQYKEGKITKKELVKEGFKGLGKIFVKKLLGKII